MASTGAAGLVEKATSDFLIGPDWAMNLDICDVINTDPGQAREIIKAVKKRLGNKNPRVQLLALTVLETLIKNCGEIVHQQIAEKEVLNEMVKIVRKKSDMNVRDKILVLIDAWQEAFGGQRGKYPQYFMAFDDLRRSGVEFPERAPENAVPIFTPPKHTIPVPPDHGSPAYLPTRLDAVLNPDIPSFSHTDIGTARSVLEILNEMLNAIDPHDREAVNDEVVLELVEQCHSNQRKVMQFVNSTIDEESLCQGLALNDDLQRVLAKYNALVTGSPLPIEHKTVPVTGQDVRYDQEEEEADDEFSQLAHRRSQTPIQNATNQGSKQGTQFALPPPPQPIMKLGTPSSMLEKTIDLLSGESYEERSQQAPATAPVVDYPSEQLFPYVSQQQATTNPFVSSPPFQAIPSQQNQNITASSQQQQVFTDGGLLNPLTQESSQQYQGNPAGHNTASGYVVPWAVETLNLHNHVQTPEDSSQQVHSQNVQQQQQQQQQMSVDTHRPVPESEYPSTGYNKSSAWNISNPPFTPQNLQKASPYGKNIVPILPPPPVLYTQRQQFFQQQLSNNNQQAGHSGNTLNSLEQKTKNMTLQERSRPIGQSSFSSSSSHSSLPSKEGGSKDRLFEDLVDLSSMGPKFKAAGISSSLSRPNISRAGSS